MSSGERVPPACRSSLRFCFSRRLACFFFSFSLFPNDCLAIESFLIRASQTQEHTHAAVCLNKESYTNPFQR